MHRATSSPTAPIQTLTDQPAIVCSLVEWFLKRLDDSFLKQAIVDPLPSLPFQEPQIWTWGEVIAAAVEFAAHCSAAGLKRGDRLAHLEQHSVDWIIVDLACLLSGIVHVALHSDALPAEQISQVDWLGAQGILLRGSGLRVRPRDFSKRLIVMDMRQQGLSRPQGLCDSLLSLRLGSSLAADKPRLRAEVERLARECDPDACATILLSSGTSGRPHGVLHCQRAMALNAQAAADVFLDAPSDVRLSWLPMSHSLARTGDLYTALLRGGCLSVVSDRRRVLEACQAFPPTVVLGVPAFFERLEGGVNSAAIAALRPALGGQVRGCVSGGAALRQRTIAVFESQGVPLVQGYGLAEAGPVVTLANPRTARVGTVGPSLAGVEIKIDSRPQSRGQLLVRTPSRALGILWPGDPLAKRRPAQTDPATGTAKEARLEQEHLADWIETGDMAVIHDGHLSITGRLVDTLVLSSGLKLPPAEIERVLAEDSAVAQVCVIGAGLAWPVALVVPEPFILRAALKSMGVRVLSRRAALVHPAVLAWVSRRIARRQQGLPRAWQVRRMVLIDRPFTAAQGEATESLKLKRSVITDHFQWVLDAAHAEHPPAWMAVVGSGQHHQPANQQRQVDTTRPLQSADSFAAMSLWQDGTEQAIGLKKDRQKRGWAGGGFTLSGQRAAQPLRDKVASVVEQAQRVIEQLRADGDLYEASLGSTAGHEPALSPSNAGKFSQLAEEALAETGFWGLGVPEQFGGSGCTLLELSQVITRIAAIQPTAAGMLSVHSSIGAVSALTAFGSPSQQARHLPALAEGRPLSIFGATEPGAGCDLNAIRTRLERCENRWLLTGTKIFITGATYGRLVKVLARYEGQAVVVLVRLPDADSDTFCLRGYGLHPLKHAHNNALEFKSLEVDEADLLSSSDATDRQNGMQIIWHGLNRGRVTLAAQAAGTLRILLAGACDYANKRQTFGQPIAMRQLVQGRLARMAAGGLACESLAAWAATAIDCGTSGENEAIVAKIIASQCVREGAIDALGIHGGQAFLIGHSLGDSFHDHLAVTVYEGESDLLGLALFKGLGKHHPLANFRGTSLVQRAAAWLAWRAGRLTARHNSRDATILDRCLRDHAAVARRQLAGVAVRIDRVIRQHGKELAVRQLEIGALSTEVQHLLSVLAVAHYADALGDSQHDIGDSRQEQGHWRLAAADCWCRLALARARGVKLSAADHAAYAQLGQSIVKARSAD